MRYLVSMGFATTGDRDQVLAGLRENPFIRDLEVDGDREIVLRVSGASPEAALAQGLAFRSAACRQTSVAPADVTVSVTG